MSTTPDPTTALAYGLATWVFLLHVAGVDADDADLHEGCRAVRSADDEEAGNAAGEALVERVKSVLAGAEPSQVKAFATRLYGDRARFDLGDGDRGERTHRVRQYQFTRSLPWLARIWERQEDGSVAPTWMVIERVTDQVTAMDPNPWNDIDETRHLPVGDFLVLWELDDCTSIALS